MLMVLSAAASCSMRTAPSAMTISEMARCRSACLDWRLPSGGVLSSLLVQPPRRVFERGQHSCHASYIMALADSRCRGQVRFNGDPLASASGQQSALVENAAQGLGLVGESAEEETIDCMTKLSQKARSGAAAIDQLAAAESTLSIEPLL